MLTTEIFCKAHTHDVYKTVTVKEFKLDAYIITGKRTEITNSGLRYLVDVTDTGKRWQTIWHLNKNYIKTVEVTKKLYDMLDISVRISKYDFSRFFIGDMPKKAVNW